MAAWERQLPSSWRKRLPKPQHEVAVPELIRSIGPVLLALGAGACLVVQAGISSSLRAALGSWAWPGLVSYVGGTLAMLLVLTLRQEPWPAARTSGLHPLIWTG